MRYGGLDCELTGGIRGGRIESGAIRASACETTGNLAAMTAKEYAGRSDLSRARHRRFEDARALLRMGRWTGAMYVSGYAIECLLKVKLMDVFRCDHLTELEKLLIDRRILAQGNSVFTHRLRQLLGLMPGFPRLQAAREFWKDFVIVNRWTESWRYSPGEGLRHEAERFILSAERVLHYLDHNT